MILQRGKFLFVWVTFLIVAFTTFTKAFPIEELKEEVEKLNTLYQVALQQEQGKHDYKLAEQTDQLEVANIMGIDGGIAESDTPSFCLHNGSSATPNMTYEDLQQMINTVEIVFGSQSTLRTYVAVDYGSSIYSDFDPLNALFRLFSQYEDPANSISLPDTLWMSKSPCPACAKRIMFDYEKESTKPTIYSASLFTGEDFADTIESIQCLTKLMYRNYTVLPWDWNEFREQLHNEDCRNAIGIALEDEGFLKESSMFLAVLELTKQLTQLPEDVLETWCIIP